VVSGTGPLGNSKKAVLIYGGRSDAARTSPVGLYGFFIGAMMASRRMVSLKIIGSARFIKMPQSTQNLYFHLIMRADDDGVVEAFNVMRMVGSTEDDIKVLTAKGFVIVLNEDLVSYITDWNEHNLIRADRKIDSIYKDLLLQIVPEIRLIEHKERADKKQPDKLDSGWTADGQRMDSIGKDRLGKDSSGEDNDNNGTNSGQTSAIRPQRFQKPTVDQIADYCTERSNSIDPQQFFDYYESNGWKVGRNPMKDWKSAVRYWERNNAGKQTGRKQPTKDPWDDPDYYKNGNVR